LTGSIPVTGKYLDEEPEAFCARPINEEKFPLFPRDWSLIETEVSEPTYPTANVLMQASTITSMLSEHKKSPQAEGDVTATIETQKSSNAQWRFWHYLKH
jgi:hypothetical protein